MTAWTEDEINYLHEYTGIKNFTEIARDLGRTSSSVRAKAAEVGLKNTVKWPEEHVQLLKENAGKLSYSEIGEKLGRTEKSVNLKANHLGITGKIARWTDEEDDFIEAHAGTHTIQWIANKLGRPKESLRIHMVDLGVGNLHFEMGSYSAKALAEIIGVSHESVRRWVLNKGLPAKKKSRYTGVSKQYKHYHITAEDFWKWAEKHRDFVEFNKIEPHSLPPEPKWVEEERRKQFYNPPKQKIWTEDEDKLLISLYYKKALTQPKIAEQMGRTRNSIEKRLKKLRDMGIYF